MGRGDGGLGDAQLPTGWFSVARAADVPRGGVLAVRRFGRELVLFRTGSGALSLVDAACPHLGAHLGHGGRVDGEALVCPFHGFRFGVDGACRRTGTGGRPPRGARLTPWHLAERAGVVFAWHAPEGGAPTWALPDVGGEGFPRHRLRRVAVTARPLDTTENSVDLAHFAHVHGYGGARIVAPLRIEGHVLRIAYEATRPTGPLGTPVTFVYRVEAHGLGFSRVRVEVEGLATIEMLVLAGPVDAHASEVWLGASVRPEARAWLPRWARDGIGALASPALAAVLAHDVTQDAVIWANKLPIERPLLAADDGPIGRYRVWADQFVRSSTAARAAS